MCIASHAQLQLTLLQLFMNLASQQQAAAVLVNLSNSPECRGVIAQPELMRCLVQVLQLPQAHPKTHSLVLRALVNIVCEPSLKQAIAMVPNMLHSVLVLVLRKPHDQLQLLQCYAVTFFQNLSADAQLREVLAGWPALVEALTVMLQQGQPSSAAAATISNLCTSSPETQARLSENAFLMKALYGCMGDDTRTQSQAAAVAVLRTMAADGQLHNRLMGTDILDMIDHLLAAPPSEDVTVQAVAFVRNLAANPASARALFDREGTALLCLRCLTSSQLAVQEQALGALQNLLVVAGAPQLQVIQEAVALEHLLSLIKMTQPALSQLAAHAIENWALIGQETRQEMLARVSEVSQLMASRPAMLADLVHDLEATSHMRPHHCSVSVGQMPNGVAFEEQDIIDVLA